MNPTEMEATRLAGTAAPVAPALILIGNGTANPSAQPARNAGTALKLDWFEGIAVNGAAAERRVAQLTGHRKVEATHRAAWLVKALQCLDLTMPVGDDTPGSVRRLCAEARRPLREDVVEALGLDDDPPKVAAVCVYPLMVATAVKALEGSAIPVAAVATGFPAGPTPLPQRLAEIRHAVDEGADEIDIAIHRAHVLLQDWQALYDEVRAMREASGTARLKAILATGGLGTPRNVYKASMVAMMAGADFIETSAGEEAANAARPAGLVMLRALRDYGERTGQRIGFKAAGGRATARDAIAWQVLAKEELGRSWLEPDLFRIGASSLLAEIERQLGHLATGRYASATHRALA